MQYNVQSVFIENFLHDPDYYTWLIEYIANMARFPHQNETKLVQGSSDEDPSLDLDMKIPFPIHFTHGFRGVMRPKEDGGLFTFDDIEHLQPWIEGNKISLREFMFLCRTISGLFFEMVKEKTHPRSPKPVDPGLEILSRFQSSRDDPAE
jgi:hypothetical protein